MFSGSRVAQTAGQNERLIAFTRVFAHAPQQRVFLIGDEGHGLRPLKTTIVPSGQPRWSPDGHWLVFRGGADDDLYVIRPDGSSLRNLTHDSAHEQDPAWSPDQSRIAYTRFPTPSSPASIWVLRVPTGKATRLTPDSLGASAPSWSPDGSEIAFVSQTQRHGYTPELWLMRADGSHQHHIFPALDGASDPKTRSRNGRRTAPGSSSTNSTGAAPPRSGSSTQTAAAFDA